MLRIELATTQDIETLTNLEIVTYRETYLETIGTKDVETRIIQKFGPDKQLIEISEPNRKIFIAWVGTEAIGFTQVLLPGKNVAWLEALYVKKCFQGQGIGEKLFKKCIETAQMSKYSIIQLHVYDKNLQAIRFYLKYKFKEIGKKSFIISELERLDLVFERSI